MPAHNLAPTAPDEPTVYGACRPGWPRDEVGTDAVKSWIADLREAGVDRVCCLLDEQHLAACDDLLGRYRSAFGADNVCHTPVPDFGASTRRYSTTRSCRCSTRRTRTVTASSSTVGRTGADGHVLALWLVHGRGYDLEAAVETVRATGQSPLEAVALADLVQV